MAKKISKKAAPVQTRKVGRPAKNSDEDAPKKAGGVPKGHKPLVIHVPIKLHGAFKVTCQALGTNASEALREAMQEFIEKNQKKAIAFLKSPNLGADEEEDEVEDVEEEVEEEEEEEVEEEEDEDEDEDE